MARIRRFDGSKIYNEPWDSETRDIFFYLVGVRADNYGLFAEDNDLIAAATKLPLHHVQDRISLLVEQDVLIPYIDRDRTYYSFRNWQGYQQVKYPGSPACPLPPPIILGRLSQETRELIQKASQKYSRAVVVAVDSSSNELLSGGEPSANGVNPVKKAVDYFYQRLRRHTDLEKPVFPFGHACRFFKERFEDADDTWEDFKDTIDEFFDYRIRGDKSSANFSLFHSAYNALCISVARKRKLNAKQS